MLAFWTPLEEDPADRDAYGKQRPQNACRNHEKPLVFWSVLCQIHPSLSEVSLMKGRNLPATSSEFLADTTRPISTTKSSTDLGEKLTFMDVWSCTKVKVVSEHAQHIPTCSWFGTWNHDLPSRTVFFRTKCWYADSAGDWVLYAMANTGMARSQTPRPRDLSW